MRPAWYVLKPRWARYINILHWPFSLWHLSYVVIGAACAASISWTLLGWTLLAFALAMGIGAHALDLLKGDPLKTGIPKGHLKLLAITSITGAIGIGVFIGLTVSLWIIPFILFGGAIVVLYNLELFQGRFHNIFWFSFSWGVFPAFTGYFVQSGDFSSPLIWLVGVVVFLFSYVQRVLSKRARYIRRQMESTPEGLRLWMLTPLEEGLKVLNGVVIVLAITLLVGKVGLII